MGSAPQAPVPNSNTETAQQFAYNQAGAEQQQAMSNVNQQTPYGNLTYTQTGYGPGGVPTYTATSQLSPQQQYLLNAGQTSQGLAATQAAQLMGGVNYGGSPNIGNMTSGLTGQMMGSEFNALNPIFNQQQSQMQSQLANQGLTYTDPAYQVAMNNLMQSQGQTWAGAAAQFQPTAFQEAQSAYNMPLQTAESLYQFGAPGSLSGQYINTPTASVGGVNVPGAAAVTQSALNQNSQLAQQDYGSQMSGIFGLGSAALKALPLMMMA